MKAKLLALAAVTAAGVVAIKQPATAHHAFSAEFYANLPVRLGGPITRVEWINPHTWIHLDNNDPESTRDPGAWMVEGGTPNTLLRRGINRSCSWVLQVQALRETVRTLQNNSDSGYSHLTKSPVRPKSDRAFC